MTSEFSDWLQREMDRREWGVTRLARALGINHGTVSLWLSGDRRPSPKSLDRIADVLVYDLDELLALAGHRSRMDESRLAYVHARLDRYLEKLTDEQTEGVKRILETIVGPVDDPTESPSSPPHLDSSRRDKTGSPRGGG